MPNNTPTATEIAQHYSAAGDSVTLIDEVIAAKNTLTAEELEKKYPDHIGTISRNVDHLEIMVAKDFWTTEDLAPFNAAITKGKTSIE